MKRFQGKFIYSVGFGILFLLLIGAGLFYYANRKSNSLEVVRIGYGNVGQVRKYFLEQLARHGKERNLDIRLIPTNGADQTLTLIDQNSIDLGLVPGAVEDRASRSVVEVMPLYMEPLHLLVKEELYETVLKDFGQLKGKSIYLDNPASTTNLFATELLKFIGLHDPATAKPLYRALYLPESQLLQETDKSVLPDAIFEVGGVPSQTIRQLVTEHNYRLLPLPFGGSFSLDKFREAETADPAASPNLRLNKNFVEEDVVPAFAYGVLPAVPPADLRTIATRLVLVGSPRLDDRVVHRVLDLILSPEVSELVKPALTLDLLKFNFEFDRHPGTERYQASLKPFNLDEALGAYGKVCEVWGIIAAAYFLVLKYWKAWRERKGPEPGTSVAHFLSEILVVEAAAGPSCASGERIALDQKLSDIKKQAIELHLEGKLVNAEELQAMLVTLADTRTKIWGAGA